MRRSHTPVSEVLAKSARKLAFKLSTSSVKKKSYNSKKQFSFFKCINLTSWGKEVKYMAFRILYFTILMLLLRPGLT